MKRQSRLSTKRFKLVDGIIDIRTKSFVKKYPYVLQYCSFDDIKQDLYANIVLTILKNHNFKDNEHFIKAINLGISWEFIETLKKSYDYLSFFQVSDLSHVEYEKTKLENDVFEDDIDRKLFEDAVIRAISTVKKSQERKMLFMYLFENKTYKEIGKKFGISKQWSRETCAKHLQKKTFKNLTKKFF